MKDSKTPPPIIQFIDRYTSCPLCGDTSLTPEFNLSIFNSDLYWDRCLNCSLVFQNPRLETKSIENIYIAMDYWGIRNNTHTSAYRKYLENDHMRISNGHRRLNIINKVRCLTGGKLLDIGSATGSFGVAARQRGFDVTCVEPSEEIAKQGIERYGLNFEISTLECLDIKKGEYDIITLWGTDSHFLNPLTSFTKLLSGLKPGGLFCMNYQNFDHWIRLIFPGLKISWNAMYNLTDKSFSILMGICGMRELHRTIEWNRLPVTQVMGLVKFNAPSWADTISFSIPAISIPTVILTNRH